MKKRFAALLMVTIIGITTILPFSFAANTNRSTIIPDFEKLYDFKGLEGGINMIPTRDGGFLVSGHISEPNELFSKEDASTIIKGEPIKPTSEYFVDSGIVMKLDSKKNVQWVRKIQFQTRAYVYTAVQNMDNSYTICGSYEDYSSNNTKAFIMKLSPKGALVWKNVFNLHSDQFLSSLAACPDGSVIAVGHQSDNSVSKTGILLKVNPKGNIEWQTKLPDTYSGMLFSITASPKGGYWVSGLKEVKGTDKSNGYLLRLDAKGHTLWSKAYVCDNIGGFVFTSETAEGGCIAAGRLISTSNNSSGWIVRTDSHGKLLWQNNLKGYHESRFWSAFPMSDGKTLAIASVSKDSETGYTTLAILYSKNGTMISSTQISKAFDCKSNSGFMTKDDLFLVGYASAYVNSIADQDIWIAQMAIKKMTGKNDSSPTASNRQDTTIPSGITVTTNLGPDDPSQETLNAINEAIGKNLIPEDLLNQYKKPLNRIEFCRLIVALLHSELGRSVDRTADEVLINNARPFTDTTHPDTLTAYASGCFDDFPFANKVFEADKIITRQEIALIIANTYKVFTTRSVEPLNSVIADQDQIAPWAIDSVKVAVSLGVMTLDDGKFSPDRTLTREEAFRIILNLSKAVKKGL